MVSSENEPSILTFKGCNYLKQRLLLATLSGKSIRIEDIRSLDVEPGLRDYEINLIRLFDKVTNGTRIDVNDTGTAVSYQPGLLYGGTIQHECCSTRGIGYFLDILIALGPFCKQPLNVILRGVTNSPEGPSVDQIKGGALNILKRALVVDDGLELKVNKRGLMPAGGGEVLFRCPVRKSLRPLQVMDSGMVKRIRGTVYACRISPEIANRVVEAAKGAMLNFLPDIYIHTDQTKGRAGGNSPGFGVYLQAETTTEVFFGAEGLSKNVVEVRENKDALTVPEELGREVANKLLEEIYRGGCVDSTFQWLVTLFMALGQQNVSKFLTGPLSQYTIRFLQHLREFFNVTFKLENPQQVDEDGNEVDDDEFEGANKVLMTCIGIGYTNINKRTN